MKAISEIDDPRLVKALAHPLRVRILRILETETSSPNEIAIRLDAPVANVSYHVRALARVGIIELVHTKQARGAICHYYRAVGRTRVTDKAWAQVPAIVKAGLVDSALDQIGDLAINAAVDGGFERSTSVLSRQAFVLDEDGFAQAAKLAAQLIDDVRAIEAEGLRRRASDPPTGDGTFDTCLAVMLFESQEDRVPGRRNGKSREAGAKRSRARAAKAADSSGT